MRRLEPWVVGLGTVAATVVLALRKLADFDLPGHLAVGRLVATTHGRLRVDDLSYTHRPIQNVEYVSDVILYFTSRLGGPFALQVLGAFLALGIATCLVASTKRAGWVAVPVVALTIAAVQPWLLVRPATASFLLLAILFVAIFRSRVGTSRTSIVGVTLLFALWSNVHGFVLVGLAVIAGYTLYSFVCRIARGRLGGLAPESHGRDATRVAAATLGAAAGSMCNQAGIGLLTAPLRASNDFGHITEWETTTFAFLVREAPLVLVVVVIAIAALALGGDAASPAQTRSSPTLLDLGLVALALVLGRSAVRMLPVACILIAPVVIRRIAGRLPDTSRLSLVAAVSACLVAPWMFLASPAQAGVGFDATHFSERATDYIVATKPTGNMYNSLPLGGWLDWKLYPAFRTFVDHRQGWVHDPAVLKEYYASETDAAAFARLATEFKFEWAVVFAAEGSELGVPIAHSPSWAMVYWDDATAIYVRTEGPNAPTARHGYRLMRHLTAPGDVLMASVRRDEMARRLALDGRLAKRQAPDSPRATFLAGCAAIALDDRASLDVAVADLALIRPGHPGLEMLRAGWDAAESAGTAQP